MQRLKESEKTDKTLYRSKEAISIYFYDTNIRCIPLCVILAIVTGLIIYNLDAYTEISLLVGLIWLTPLLFVKEYIVLFKSLRDIKMGRIDEEIWYRAVEMQNEKNMTRHEASFVFRRKQAMNYE